MPDLQTALSKVINEWETPTQLSRETAPNDPSAASGNGVTRATFAFIKSHPGMARTNIVKQLGADGFKYSSTTSIIGQMLRQGMVKEVNNGLFVTQPNYTPIRSAVLAAARPKRQPPAPQLSLDTSQPSKPEWSVHEALKGLTVLQARELFDELRKIFRE